MRSAGAGDGRFDVSPGICSENVDVASRSIPASWAAVRGLDFDGRGGSEFVGGPDVLADLTRLGLARKVPRLSNRAGGYVALRPDLGLRAILDRQQDHLITGFRALMDGVGYLADLQPTIIDPATTPGQLVQVLTDSDEISRVSAGLITDTREQWMTMETMHTEMPLTEDAICECPPSLRGRITMRTIYDRSFTAARNGRRIIERCISEGEHARVLPELPMKAQACRHERRPAPAHHDRPIRRHPRPRRPDPQNHPRVLRAPLGTRHALRRDAPAGRGNAAERPRTRHPQPSRPGLVFMPMVTRSVTMMFLRALVRYRRGAWAATAAVQPFACPSQRAPCAARRVHTRTRLRVRQDPPGSTRIPPRTGR